jgi:hypothetical protein
MAAILAGAWRSSLPPLQMSEDTLTQITLGLLRTKSGPLAWWRVRHSSLGVSPAGARLRTAYYNHGLQAALHSRNLVRIVNLMREAGVEPVLVKGLAIGRLYPERGLRPFEDLDLCVRPDQYAAASEIVRNWTGERSPVDLHAGFPRLYALSWDDLYSRSQLVTLSGLAVRVLAPEDHLRYLCLHQLKHGLPSPMWLCDIAIALESRPNGFDWDRVLGPDRRQADCVACTIGLAHHLLGARVDDTPVASRSWALPKWLAPSVLEGWGRQCPPDYRGPELYPRTRDLLARGPATIRQYWPSPVAASVHLRMPFSGFPRGPIQVVDGLIRLARVSVRQALHLRPAPHSD